VPQYARSSIRNLAALRSHVQPQRWREPEA
jgi:hypothetical protein